MRHTAHTKRGSDDASPNPFKKYFLFRFGTFHTNKPLFQAVALRILILTQGQKEGFSYQLHSESEAIGEGIALGDAVHLIHAVLELFERFLRPLSIRGLLSRERTFQFLTVPGNQLQ